MVPSYLSCCCPDNAYRKGSEFAEIHYHAPEVEEFKKQYNTLSSVAEKKHFVEEAIAGVAQRKQVRDMDGHLSDALGSIFASMLRPCKPTRLN